jgi:Fic family protein
VGNIASHKLSWRVDMVTATWKFIEDLPENWQPLHPSELESLASVWKEQSVTLQKQDAFKQFNDRLRREWAIETGIIENLYSIDRGITQLLIEKGIESSLIPYGSTDRPAEQIVPILKDQEEVLEGLFDFVARRRDLSTSYIKELHQALTRHQETVQAVDELGRMIEVKLLRGQWKQYPNNPSRPGGEVHEYCPPEHVDAEMDALVKMHLEHVENAVPPEIEAAWLHHRFTQVHPFQDGNGRIARALASLVFLRAGWFPLVINRDLREEYIDALEKADTDDLGLLATLFSRIEKKAFIRALSLSENVLQQPSPLRQVITSATDRLRARRWGSFARMQSKAFELSKRLEEVAKNRLESVEQQLNEELRSLDDHYFANVWKNDAENDFWFRKDIIEVANRLDYYADTRTYRAWVRLRIIEDRQTDLVFSFHSLGVEFLGIMAVSTFLEFRDRKEGGEASVDGPYELSREVFQFSYNESERVVTERFEQWLNDALLAGLEQWRKQL